MEEEAAIDLTIKTGDAEKNTQSVKARIKEIKAALLDLDEGSEEFKKLSQEAGRLTDKVGDVNKRINALASDTKKLDAVVGVAQGIAGGFAAAQGAIALFGQENEDLNKTLVKVQGSIALLNGVQQIANTLNKESAAMISITTAAQKAWNFVIGTTEGLMKGLRVAIAATGIGALAVGLIALVSNFEAVSDWTKKVIDRFDFLKITINKLGEAWTFVSNKMRDFLSQFGLMDSVAEHQAELAKERDIKRLELQVKNWEKAIALDKAMGKDTYDLEQKLWNDKIALAKLKGEEYYQLLADQVTAIRKKQKEDAELSAKEEERRRDAEFASRFQRMDIIVATNVQEVDLEKQKAEAIKGVNVDLTEAIKTEEAKRLEARKQSVEDIFMLTQQSLTATMGLSDVFYQNQLNAAVGNDKKTREIKKKQFETNKIFTVSQIVLDTVMGMLKALATNPPPSPVGIASSIAVGIAGTAATIKALATKFEGGGGGAITPPSVNVGGDVAGPSPNSTVPQVPQTPQSIPIPQQVFVTETDITGVQGQVQVIENLSKIQ